MQKDRVLRRGGDLRKPKKYRGSDGNGAFSGHQRRNLKKAPEGMQGGCHREKSREKRGVFQRLGEGGVGFYRATSSSAYQVLG